MAKDSQHVLSSERGGWIVKKTGALKASRSFDSQKEAVAWGQSLAKSQSSELYVHGKDGRILEKRSYGHDSYSVSLESSSGRGTYVKRDSGGKLAHAAKPTSKSVVESAAKKSLPKKK